MVPFYKFETVVPFGNPAYDSGLGGSHDMDVKAPPNYPVTTLLPGIVSDISAPSWGKQVGLKLDVPYNGVPYHAYLHLAAVDPGLFVGKHLNAGDRIGWSGGGTQASDYLGTTNPTGSNFLNDISMSSQTQQGIALMRGASYGGIGWETFPPVDWNLDPTPLVDKARQDYDAHMASPALRKLGRIGLFFGIETYTWTQAQWQAAAQFCVTHKINFAIIKTFEVTQGEWYAGNFLPIAQTFWSKGVAVLPYGFVYGGASLAWEISMLQKYQGIYGAVCADMEGGPWWNNAADAQKIHDALAATPGLFFGSIPADPGPTPGASPSTFSPLAPLMYAMPMSYDDSLVAGTAHNMAAVGSMPIYPTLDLSGEFGPNNVAANAQWARQYDQVSLWYYGFAVQNTGLLDQAVTIIGSLPAQGVGKMGVPSGWQDTVVNGDPRLINPVNTFYIRGAFRNTVLNWPGGWEAWNVPRENEQVNRPGPIEQSNPKLGPGVSQLCQDRRLEMLDASAEKVIAGWIGQELDWYRQTLATTQASLQQTQASLATCQAALSACQAAGGGSGIPQAVQDAINLAVSKLTADQADLNTVMGDMQAMLVQLQPLAK